MQSPSPRLYRFGDFTLDLEAGLLTRKGNVVSLRNKSFEVLRYLVERHGRLVTKTELLDAVWGDTAVTENSLTQCLTEIRRMLEDDAQQMVRTVARRGYIFTAPIAEPGTASARELSTRSDVNNGLTPVPKRAVPTAWYRRMWIWALGLLIPIGMAGSWFLWPSPKPSSLAVLPFQRLDPGAEQFLELGMTDSLITRLSLVRGLSVRPWASVQMYIQNPKDPVALGRDLKVESVLDGSMQRSGDRIRVTARMYRISDGKLLWAEKFDEPYGDIFRVQDTISEKVAAALSVRLGRPTLPPVKPEAYEAYVRGRYFFELFTREGNQKAKEYFERAIELEPDFALAQAGLAMNYGPMRVRGFILPLEDRDKHRKAAEKALALDDSLPEAHLAMFTVFFDERKWDLAEHSLKRAIELNPNYLHAWGFYAFMLHALGRHEDALAASQRTLEIDPVSDYAAKDLASSLVWLERYEDARVQATKAVELRPDFAPAQVVLANAYMGLKQTDKAYEHFQLAGDQVNAAIIRAKKGDTEPARELIALLKQRPARGGSLAALYTALGDKTQALNSLESAYEDQVPSLAFVAVDPRLLPLHGDPRFESLVSRMNLCSASTSACSSDISP